MSEPNKTELLLPWYATGKLSPEERAEVEAYLKEHPEAAEHLAVVQEELDETITLNQAIPAPPAGGLDRLMTRLDSEFGPAVEVSDGNWWQSLMEGISGAFQFPVMRYAAVAAALIIAIQGASIVSLMNRPATVPGGYETASGPGSVTVKGTVLLMSFNDKATAVQISALLEETGGSIIKGPAGGGIFQVRFDKKDEKETQTLINALEARKDVISFVAINE